MDMRDFEIRYMDPSRDDERTLKVNHSTETFDLEFDGSAVSLINNGDNSWSLVEGDLDQVTVNLIGDAIEKSMRGR